MSTFGLLAAWLLWRMLRSPDLLFRASLATGQVALAGTLLTGPINASGV